METTEPTPCQVIDFATYAARRPRCEPKPDTYADDVRAELLDDLAAWPPVFQRRLRAGVEEQTREVDPTWWFVRRFCRGRAVANTAGTGRSAPWNFNFDRRLAYRLSQLRRAAAEVRAATTRRSRAHRRRTLATCKANLLELLWLHGQPRIDRAVQAANAVAFAREECEYLGIAVQRARADAAEHTERLVENRYLKGARKGHPLSEPTRRGFRRCVAKAQRDMAEHTARRALLLELLDDVPALVRELTGCRRG